MLPEFLEYTFMQRALMAGVMTALIRPPIGVFLVPRRLSLMADTLAHMALAGVALGLFLGASVRRRDSDGAQANRQRARPVLGWAMRRLQGRVTWAVLGPAPWPDLDNPFPVSRRSGHRSLTQAN
jgi:hypothetical protein